MKLFLFVVIVFGFGTSYSFARNKSNAWNGNLIAEPKLKDYQRAERTPCFSPITDITDANGNPVSN